MASPGDTVPAKPRSRTGCTTCKIRKVKCDESKPSCAKCTSTGRVCDGYSLVRQYNTTAAKRRPRAGYRIVQVSAGGISGTSSEKQFFHTFRAATEAGLTLHESDASSFWVSLAPRLAQFDDAVKHALVALGATYHFFKVAKHASRSDVTRRYNPSLQGHISRLEIFIIRNYNLAIRKLQTYIASSRPDVAILALTCCLVFVVLENLRFNLESAITHLRNGAQILQKSFDPRRLFSSPPSAPSQAIPDSISKLASNDELRTIVTLFRHLEIAIRLFAFDVPLTVTSRLYDSSRLDNRNCVPHEFNNVSEAHQTVLDLVNDVMGYDWATTRLRGDPGFWTSPGAALRHGRLYERANTVLDRYKAFMTSPNAPMEGSRGAAVSYQDILQTLAMRGMIELMPDHVSAQHQRTDRLAEIIYYAEKLLLARRAFVATMKSPFDFTVESGLVATLYYGCVYATDPGLKAKAISLLSECSAREGPWDGRSLVKVVQMCSQMDDRVQPSVANNGPLPRWGSEMDCYRLFLALDITEW